jgi:choline kinase
MRTRNITTTKKSSKTDLYDNLMFIITAAGAGHRMKYSGPKALTDINGIPVIERQIDIISSAYPNADIVVVTGFESSKIHNILHRNILTVDNPLYEENNIAASIGVALRVCKDKNVCVVNGDLVFNKEAIPTKIKKSTVVLDKTDGLMNSREVGVVVDKDVVENMMYDIPKKWGQIAFFFDNELELLRQICFSYQKRNLYTFEVINEIIDKRGNFSVYDNSDIKIMDIDVIQDIDIAKKEFI